MIAVSRTDGDGRHMGKVLFNEASGGICIHPWNFMWGGLDGRVTQLSLKAEDFTFLYFPTLEKMDAFFAMNFWNQPDEQPQHS